MSALLLDIQPGDEVIIPSYTFVTSASAFVLRGATIRFADSYPLHPNMDPEHVASLITERTKAILVMHYAGVACDMDKIMDLATQHGIAIIEDAAQCIDSYYKQKPLGSIGQLASFSFHDTKNIISGEGGLLVVNDQELTAKSEILWEKGTNRSAFMRGEISKYSWVDLGSSFLPSEMTAAFLWTQLEKLEYIQSARVYRWNRYLSGLQGLHERGAIYIPSIPDYATNNGHTFYFLCRSETERGQLIDHLKSNHISAYFHYLGLHKSPYFLKHNPLESLPNAESIEGRLLRLPLYVELSDQDQDRVIQSVESFYTKHESIAS